MLQSLGKVINENEFYKYISENERSLVLGMGFGIWLSISAHYLAPLGV